MPQYCGIFMLLSLKTVYQCIFSFGVLVHGLRVRVQQLQRRCLALVAHAGAAGARQLARHRRHLRRYPSRRQAPAAPQRRQMGMERRYVPRHFFSSSRKSAPSAEVSTV